MHQADAMPNLDEQQKRRLVNYYIFVTLSAGLLVPYSVRVIALALGILQNTYHLKDFAWLSLPFIYLSVYLARKKSQWDVKMFVTMWLMAMQTAYVIYLIAGLYMEAHELEGRRISGLNFSPRNVLIFVLLPFFTIFCMRFAMSLTHRFWHPWVSNPPQTKRPLRDRLPHIFFDLIGHTAEGPRSRPGAWGKAALALGIGGFLIPWPDLTLQWFCFPASLACGVIAYKRGHTRWGRAGIWIGAIGILVTLFIGITNFMHLLGIFQIMRGG